MSLLKEYYLLRKKEHELKFKIKSIVDECFRFEFGFKPLLLWHFQHNYISFEIMNYEMFIEVVKDETLTEEEIIGKIEDRTQSKYYSGEFVLL